MSNNDESPYNEDDVSELYRLIGRGVWHLQHLENVLASFILLKKLQKDKKSGTKISQSVLEAAQAKEREKTLGPLISSGKSEKCFPNELSEKFDSYLVERHWLIHKCVIEEFLALRNVNAKLALFTRIDNFANTSIHLQNELSSLFETWFTENGYNIDRAYAIADQNMANAERS